MFISKISNLFVGIKFLSLKIETTSPKSEICKTPFLIGEVCSGNK